MKALIILALASILPGSVLASTRDLDCKVSKMHYNSYFEEGLSEEEYPDVEYRIDPTMGQVLSIGMHQDITDADGDRIVVVPTTGFKTVIKAQRRGDKDVILLETDYLRGNDGKVRHVGRLSVKEAGEKEFRRIASLICR